MVRWSFRHPAVERLVEGTATVLVEQGVLKPEALERELITAAELASAAHRQGYLSIEDLDRATLEPGGGLTFAPRQATTRVRRHEEIMGKLDSLQRLVDDLRRDIATGREP